MKAFILTLSFVIITFVLRAQLAKRIYLANDDHTDYMWTGDEETYKKAFLEMLDYYIKLNDSTAHLSYHRQNKWNCDGSYWVYNYRETRPVAQFNKRIRHGQPGWQLVFRAFLRVKTLYQPFQPE